MPVIPDARSFLFQEETQFRSAVSESLLTKVGASNNHILNRQFEQHSWHLNGRFSLLPVQGPDGIYTFLFPAEVTGFFYTCGVTGVSGTTEVDIRRINSSGSDLGSIFSTEPAISNTAADGSFTVFRQTDSTTIANPAGHTLAVVSTTTFAQGDGLRLDVNSAAGGAQNFQFTLMYRPT